MMKNIRDECESYRIVEPLQKAKKFVMFVTYLTKSKLKTISKLFEIK